MHFIVNYDMLNMFRALLCPSSEAPNYMCVFAAYGVPCILLSIISYGQDYARHSIGGKYTYKAGAPDDGHRSARNMLSIS